MRQALSGLTTRGRSFLAAGVALIACAAVLGERDLLRVGVFLVALPVVAVLVVMRTRYRVACTRVLDPGRVPAGLAARVVLRLENLSRLPTGVLMVEDTLPYVLGGRPRFVLDRVEPQGMREVTYSVRSDLRGRYEIGPLAIRLADPFGFCELSRSFRSVDHLIVTPLVTDIPSVRLGGDYAGGGESRLRAVAVAGEDDVATREYRLGDDLRRVHWRSTAHAGELMVRREEQPWLSRATLFLDTRSTAHRGDGLASSFEWAVSAAASIGVHLSRKRFAVQFRTDTGDELHGFGGVSDVGGGEFEGQLLDSLATVGLSRATSLSTASSYLRQAREGVVVALLGALTPDDAERLARVHLGHGAGIALLLDTTRWTVLGTTAREQANAAYAANVRLLAHAGWRVLPVAPRTTLPQIWPLAAADPVMSAARAEVLTNTGATP
ncbi:MAG: DUF58 domain-containing protein [Actinomycetes bacterium]